MFPHGSLDVRWTTPSDRSVEQRMRFSETLDGYFRGCFITVIAEVEMHPYTLARSIEVCQLPRQSLDFIVGNFYEIVSNKRYVYNKVNNII